MGHGDVVSESLFMSSLIPIFDQWSLVNPYHLDESIPSFRGFCWTFSVLLQFPQKFLQVNSADPVQMLHFHSVYSIFEKTAG